MVRTQSVYDSVVDICADYLGPASERFIRRQITTHLGKPPEELVYKDLPELTKWVRLTFAMLTDEAQLIDDLSARLAALSNTQRPPRRKNSAK